MMHSGIQLKTAPELLRVIRAAMPSYKKHTATLFVTERVTLSGTYWSGGSRSSYYAVDLATGVCSGAPHYNPPQFGGPQRDPEVEVPEGVAIVKGGIFMGKPATATVFINPANAAKLLPAPQQGA